MKKGKCVRTFVLALVFILGAAAGAFGHHLLEYNGLPHNQEELIDKKPEQDSAMSTEEGALQENKPMQRMLVVKLACQAVETMKQGDYEALSRMIHPEKGVLFAPYSTVDPETNLTFSAQEIARLEENTKKYFWGSSNGSGLPIELTLLEYFKTFVFHTDYTMVPEIGVNQILKTGNSLENVLQVYEDGVTVEFHFPSLSEKTEGMDWCSLKLVFEPYEKTYKIVAIVHSQWTI